MIAAVRRALGGAVLLMFLAVPASAFATDSVSDPTSLLFNRAQFWNTNGLTIQADEPFTADDPDFWVCGSSATGTQVAATAWFEFTGNGGPMVVTTSGSSYDTQIALFEEVPVVDGTTICSNDRLPGDADSQLFVDTVQGRGYLLQVGGCNDDNNGTCPSGGQPRTGDLATAVVTNDDKAQPETVDVAQSPVIRTNLGMTTDGVEPTECGQSDYGRTVWFRYVAPGNGRAVFTATGFDTVLSVYRGGQRVDCNDDIDATTDTARVSLDVTAGEYLVQIGGYGAGEAAVHGNFSYSVDFTPASQPPPPVVVTTPPVVVNQPAPVAPTLLRSSFELSPIAARSTRLTNFVITDVPAGGTLRITCRGRGCGRKNYTRRFTRAARKFNVTRAMRRNRPRAGAVMTIRITAPNSIGRWITLRFRSYKRPTVTRRCVQPGATKPSECP